MKTLLSTAALVLFTSATAAAQDTKGTSATPDRGRTHHCIMADASTFADLGLNNDQLASVKKIQASCQKEYDTAKAAGTKYEGVAKHETELKAVLTPEQFTKWSQWCDANKAMNATKRTKPEVAK